MLIQADMAVDVGRQRFACLFRWLWMLLMGMVRAGHVIVAGASSA